MLDYSKSIIYKLCCKDPSITDIYVGSTINFRHRKYNHKCTTNCKTNKYYNSPKAVCIRNNGGWDNWNMLMIKEFPCENKKQLEREEGKIIAELKPSLNQILNPTRNEEERKQYTKNWVMKNSERRRKTHKDWGEKRVKCDICNTEINRNCLARHNRGKKHILKTQVIKQF